MSRRKLSKAQINLHQTSNSSFQSNSYPTLFVRFNELDSSRGQALDNPDHRRNMRPDRSVGTFFEPLDSGKAYLGFPGQLDLMPAQKRSRSPNLRWI